MSNTISDDEILSDYEEYRKKLRTLYKDWNENSNYHKKMEMFYIGAMTPLAKYYNEIYFSNKVECDEYESG